MKLFLIAFFVLLYSIVEAQRITKNDKLTLRNLKSHVSFLADDKLEGRRAGTIGEKKAIQYISDHFKQMGLIPKGTNGAYTQSFDINDGIDFLNGSSFTINDEYLKPLTDYYPFSYTSNTDLKETAISPSLSEPEHTRFLNIGDLLIANKDNPHFDLIQKIRDDVLYASKNKAKAIILYNSSNVDDKIEFDPKGKAANMPIPVIYLTKTAVKKYLTDHTASYNMSLSLKIQQKTRTASNVIGYLDNKSSYTIVLGAHIDHLGYGEDGNSMNRNAPPAIHNGADDNASGTAAMLELARRLSKTKNPSFNYLFIGFSAEELGLFGSKFFVENSTIPLTTINYMINMDMVGRLSDSTKILSIGGFGTSDSWDDIILNIKNSPLKLKLDSSGTGPSDHTSFYRKDIPVLFFFTGLHSDYHRPTDDAEKINYTGTMQTVNYIYSIIKESESYGKLTFSKTREQQTSTSARFSVSLGIMPDYTFTGNGVRVDAVSEGRPAKSVGLIAGDILIKLGKSSITSVESYMQVLSKFKKGDTAELTIKRGKEEKIFNITF